MYRLYKLKTFVGKMIDHESEERTYIKSLYVRCYIQLKGSTSYLGKVNKNGSESIKPKNLSAFIALYRLRIRPHRKGMAELHER